MVFSGEHERSAVRRSASLKVHRVNTQMNDLEHAAAKYVADGLSVGVLVGTFTNVLPAIAAAMTIVWTAIRIWETDTVKRWTGRKD